MKKQGKRPTILSGILSILDKHLLLIAIVVGILFYRQLSVLSPATPYLLSIMLYISYSRITWRNIYLTRVHYILLGVQYLGSIAVYLLLKQYNETLAQAAMICVLAPTATSAPVVVGILGGNVASAATFTLVSNLSVAFIAPVYLSFIGMSGNDVSFLTSFVYIVKKVVPILILPFLLALFTQRTTPKFHERVKSAQIVSFYIWAVALTIVISGVVKFVAAQSSTNYLLEILIAVASLLICVFQFLFGRKIGSKHNATVTGGQGLGQKNTILAIWLAQTYLNPLASLGPGLCVLWQNLANSYQIWRKKQSA